MRPATPATARQEGFINRIVTEIVGRGEKFESKLSPAQRKTWEDMKAEKVIDKHDASALIGALLAIKDGLPKVERKMAQPGYYKTDTGQFLVVVENKAKTGTYAKVLSTSHSNGKTRVRWVYAPGMGYAVAELTPMTLDEAAAFGHLHGVCLVCCKALTDPESVKRGIGPVCAKRFPSRPSAVTQPVAAFQQQPEPDPEPEPSINLSALERRKRRSR